jgi:hypothetical protein
MKHATALVSILYVINMGLFQAVHIPEFSTASYFKDLQDPASQNFLKPIVPR